MSIEVGFSQPATPSAAGFDRCFSACVESSSHRGLLQALLQPALFLSAMLCLLFSFDLLQPLPTVVLFCAVLFYEGDLQRVFVLCCLSSCICAVARPSVLLLHISGDPGELCACSRRSPRSSFILQIVLSLLWTCVCSAASDELQTSAYCLPMFLHHLV